MSDVYQKIEYTNHFIEKTSEKANPDDVGNSDQSLIKGLRDLVEQVVFALFLKRTNRDLDFEPPTRSNGEVMGFFNQLPASEKFLKEFHLHLEAAASHFTPNEEGAMSLTLWYQDWIYQLKDLAKKELGIDLLKGVERLFPKPKKDLKEYYEAIWDCLNEPFARSRKIEGIYVVERIRPVFSRGYRYYEIVFSSPANHANKMDRLIAYSRWALRINYFYRFSLFDERVSVGGFSIPVTVLADYSETVRSYELNSLRLLFGLERTSYGKETDFDGVMSYLKATGFTLLDIVLLPDKEFEEAKQICCVSSANQPVFEILEKAKTHIKQGQRGSNLLSYALYRPRYRWLRKVVAKGRPNEQMGLLCVCDGTIPFETMPYASHLPSHPVSFYDLIHFVPLAGRECELLARRLSNSTEDGKQMYCDRAFLSYGERTDDLVSEFNGCLYRGHRARRQIARRGDLYYISGYESDLDFIFKSLTEMSKAGIERYSGFVSDKLSALHLDEIEPHKLEIVQKAFSTSRVQLITGAAGTGKTTVIKVLRRVFPDSRFLCLAHTHAALDNLRAKIADSGCVFKTVEGFLKSFQAGWTSNDYQIVCVDECSVIPNESMKELLSIFSDRNPLLLLVGDPYQIEAIQYGNWFKFAANYFSSICHELKVPYRTNKKTLLSLWDRVRDDDEKAIATISNSFTRALSLDDILLPRSTDEIILCLNYDGLYGVNNVNRILQDKNPGESVDWKAWRFKKGDPVLFKETSRFKDALHNNLKGRIIGFEEDEEKIVFTVEVWRTFSPIGPYCFEILDDKTLDAGHSLVRFPVYRNGRITDDDEIDDSMTIIPFQLAYAVTIHKAQGLEYQSVKIIVTDEIDEKITKNIFYTAITRARNDLAIYWSPETCERTLRQILVPTNERDFSVYLEHWKEESDI